ncbi:hypothetical protein NQZ68_029366 [Dissostichus eleginoides]|nr:hypothetical protein NQZ68_029366 [Dissostichus eleginoides]
MEVSGERVEAAGGSLPKSAQGKWMTHGDKLELLCPVLVESLLFLCCADKQAQLWVAKQFPDLKGLRKAQSFSWVNGKSLNASPSGLSASLECDHCNKLPWSAVALLALCMEVCGVWDMCSREQIPSPPAVS